MGQTLGIADSPLTKAHLVAVKDISIEIVKTFGVEYLSQYKNQLLAEHRKSREESDAGTIAGQIELFGGVVMKDDPPQVTAQVVGTLIREIDAQKHVVYTIQVQEGRSVHRTFRTHSEFRALASDLRHKYPAVAAHARADMKRRRGRRMDKEFIEERRQLLDKFVQIMLQQENGCVPKKTGKEQGPYVNEIIVDPEREVQDYTIDIVHAPAREDTHVRSFFAIPKTQALGEAFTAAHKKLIAEKKRIIADGRKSLAKAKAAAEAAAQKGEAGEEPADGKKTDGGEEETKEEGAEGADDGAKEEDEEAFDRPETPGPLRDDDDDSVIGEDEIDEDGDSKPSRRKAPKKKSAQKRTLGKRAGTPAPMPVSSAVRAQKLAAIKAEDAADKASGINALSGSRSKVTFALETQEAGDEEAEDIEQVEEEGEDENENAEDQEPKEGGEEEAEGEEEEEPEGEEEAEEEGGGKGDGKKIPERDSEARLLQMFIATVLKEVIIKDVEDKLPENEMIRKRALQMIHVALFKALAPPVNTAWGKFTTTIRSVEDTIAGGLGKIDDQVDLLKQKLSSGINKAITPAVNSIKTSISKATPTLASKLSNEHLTSQGLDTIAAALEASYRLTCTPGTLEQKLSDAISEDVSRVRKMPNIARDILKDFAPTWALVPLDVLVTLLDTFKLIKISAPLAQAFAVSVDCIKKASDNIQKKPADFQKELDALQAAADTGLKSVRKLLEDKWLDSALEVAETASKPYGTEIQELFKDIVQKMPRAAVAFARLAVMNFAITLRIKSHKDGVTPHNAKDLLAKTSAEAAADTADQASKMLNRLIWNTIQGATTIKAYKAIHKQVMKPVADLTGPLQSSVPDFARDVIDVNDIAETVVRDMLSIIVAEIVRSVSTAIHTAAHSPLKKTASLARASLQFITGSFRNKVPSKVDSLALSPVKPQQTGMKKLFSLFGGRSKEDDAVALTA